MLNLIKTIQATESSIFGSIDPIGGGYTYDDIEKGGKLTGPINFVNNALGLATVIAGIWFLFTIITSGLKIVQGARDPKVFSEEMKRILWTTLGLLLVASAWMIAGWIGNALFGSPDAILNPTIE